MKKLTFILIVLLTGQLSFAQGGRQVVGNNFEELRQTDFSNWNDTMFNRVDVNFKPKIQNAFDGLVNASKPKNISNSQNWIDVLSSFNDTLLYVKQPNAVINSNQSSSAQKSMAQLERAAFNGKGKDLIRKQDVRRAFQKYNGYSLEAMTGRMRIYIQRMESETEDE